MILVTGGCGFIGSRVAIRLLSLGHDVHIVDSMEPRVHGPVTGRTHVGDISPDWFDGVNTIVHLAAQVGVADSQTDWFRYINQNTVETAKFLQAAVGTGVRRLVVASSMSIYGDPGTRSPVTEEHRVQPASIYGLTKYDQERMCRIWGEQHNIDVVALRLFNVYGPGQALTNPYTGVLANFANALLAGDPPTVYEDGQQTRDFIYVDDVVERIVAQALARTGAGTFNVCTGYATSVLQAAQALASALGADIQPNVTGTKRSGDIRHCVGSPVLYYKTFSPATPVPFAEGIARYAKALSA